MTRYKNILLVIIILLFAWASGANALNVADTVLQDVWDSTGQSIRISYVSSESGWDVAEPTALTNTVHPLVTFTHTTSGTPANGIGLSLDWYQQTAAANTELAARIVVVATDVTGTSEDFRFDWMLMTAGATPATTMSLSSLGVLTIAGGATITAGDLTLTLGDATLTDGDLLLTDGNATVTAGNLTLTAGDATLTDGDLTLTSGDATLTDGDLTITSGFADFAYLDINSSPYTLAAASKANYITVSYTDTGAASLILAADLTVAGRKLVIKDADLNANNNNITIATAGAETIDEAATYVMNAAGEAVTLMSDGTNWFVMGAYGE